MPKKTATTRGRVVSIFAAAGIGYVLGNWHAGAVHGTDHSAAAAVATRFPQAWDGSSTASASDETEQNAAVTPVAMVLGDADVALLDPEPMISRPAVAEPAFQVASLDPVPPAPRAAPVAAAAAPASVVPKSARPVSAPKPHVAAAPRPTARPGFMLNDAQIVSIKHRLHLTPDQEQMWPAVEAALRSIAYARARDAHHHSASPSGGINPESAEVQNLKSAAIPLLMSFSSEQKDEVRNLAHVMGLDQLASQF